MSSYSLQRATSKYVLVHVNLKVATPTKVPVSITYWAYAWAHTKLCRCTTLLAKLFFYVHLIAGQKVILVSNRDSVAMLLYTAAAVLVNTCW